MKKLSLLVLFLIITVPGFSHYLWIETSPEATINTEQHIKVHYGEYNYGIIEKTDEDPFKSVAKFELWLIGPDGNKEKLETTKKPDHYSAKFTPTSNGVYTIYLKNNNIDVIDYSEYDFGIFKSFYQSFAKVSVGEKTNLKKTSLPETGLCLYKLPSNSNKTEFKVFYNGKPIAEQEVKIYVEDLWSKTLTTNKEGIIAFNLPWNTKYILETTKNEETPGTYKGDDYEFIWHCATYCIPNK